MENLNKAIIAEITGLAIDIQNAGIAEVVVDLAGYVGTLAIRVYVGGNINWKDSRPNLDITIDLLDRGYYMQPTEAIAKLTALLNTVTA